MNIASNETNKKNALNLGQFFALVDWLKTNLEKVDGRTDRAIAALATDGVGFVVTESNIYKIRTSPEAGVNLKPVRTRGNSSKKAGVTRNDRILCGQIKSLMYALYQAGFNVAVANEFKDLYLQAKGQELPDWVDRMQNELEPTKQPLLSRLQR